jgi:ABC-type Fe3+-hydroxamate transport system substrate-binding protein
MKFLLIVMALMLSGCALTRNVSERDVSHVLGRTVIVQYADADGWETRNA